MTTTVRTKVNEWVAYDRKTIVAARPPENMIERRILSISVNIAAEGYRGDYVRIATPSTGDQHTRARRRNTGYNTPIHHCA